MGFSCVLSLSILLMMSLYANWIANTELPSIVIGLIGTLLLLISVALVSRSVILVFGNEFHAKFIPDILACVALAAAAFGVVHQICTMTWILFGLVAVYGANRICLKFIDRATSTEKLTPSKSEKKKKKLKRQFI
ncbi:unnamed protein product [Ceratitis capitata]|nr:unnamed protein product [Ceratitis capitata]